MADNSNRILHFVWLNLKPQGQGQGQKSQGQGQGQKIWPRGQGQGLTTLILPYNIQENKGKIYLRRGWAYSAPQTP